MSELVRMWGPVDASTELHEMYTTNGQNTTGAPAGILVTPSYLPRIPGNPVCAESFGYQVMYAGVVAQEGVDRCEAAIDAAKYLEHEGARYIIAGSSDLADLHSAVANSVSVPVYLSTICSVPWAVVAMGFEQKLGIITKDRASISKDMFRSCRVPEEYFDRCVVYDSEGTDVFAKLSPSMHGYNVDDLRDEVLSIVKKMCYEQPRLGGIMLECPDIMPFAADIQSVCALPVFDTIVMADYLYKAVCKKHYYGYF